MMIQEKMVKWVLSVDRRLLVIKEAHTYGVIRAAELAERTDRSVQNISHAIHELEEQGLIECLTPDKNTWKRYILTDLGKNVLKDMEEQRFLIEK